MVGHWQILVILVVVLLLFGHRIPGMARSLGSGIVEFKKGLKTGEKDDKQLPQGGSGHAVDASAAPKPAQKQDEKQEAGT